MAHFHTKYKKGRPYLYVRESRRIKGKPTIVSQVYIGPPERVRELKLGRAKEPATLRVEEFGSLWLACQVDQDVGLVDIVDSVIPWGDRESGLSVGEYFLYAVLNRMIEPMSKRALSKWFKGTAIQHIRPTDLKKLTSSYYYDKWNRVSEEDLREISSLFFAKIWVIESVTGICLLFDTSNYYTYMASKTKSELAQRGKNKDGKHHLRQVGLALLVDRNSRLPLFYRVYPGNLHDSREFEAIMDEMFGVVCGLNQTEGAMTVVIDKGMNSEGNFEWIDDNSRIHFLTTYSPYFAEELAATSLERFKPVDTKKNRQLVEKEKEDDRVVAYRTKGTYWGKERTVVVTYTPVTARKKAYNLQNKLVRIRQELLRMSAKVRERAPHWRNAEKIEKRYQTFCQKLHVSSELFKLKFRGRKENLSLSFRKQTQEEEKSQRFFGKSIIITDNSDWSTEEIVQANLDRSHIEQKFRQSKAPKYVSAKPFRHWTDIMIRCHLFTCVVSMVYMRRIEIALEKAGIRRTAENVMAEMRRLHSVLSIPKSTRKPERRLETPAKTQSEILNAFGYHINDCGVLHQSSS